jgi:hypothetical protein
MLTCLIAIIIAFTIRSTTRMRGRRAVSTEYYKAGLMEIKGKEAVKMGRLALFVGEFAFWWIILLVVGTTIIGYRSIFF